MSGSGISWAICMSAPHFRQITVPAPHHSVFYRLDGLPATQLTASKQWRHSKHWRQKSVFLTIVIQCWSVLQVALKCSAVQQAVAIFTKPSLLLFVQLNTLSTHQPHFPSSLLSQISPSSTSILPLDCKSHDLQDALISDNYYDASGIADIYHTVPVLYVCLQCFDTVGWAAGRASGL